MRQETRGSAPAPMFPIGRLDSVAIACKNIPQIFVKRNVEISIGIAQFCYKEVFDYLKSKKCWLRL